MADNVTLPLTGSGDTTAGVGAKEVSFSGDTIQVQLLELVSVTGSEGARTLNEISDANGIQIQGAAAENAAVAGNPIIIGGRYDASPRTLGDGDVGAIAVDADGAVHISDGGNSLTVDGTVSITGSVTVDGSGVTQPVSGTVTANLSATDNAVLDNIDTNTDYGQVVGGGVEATALRVTLASDSTGVLSVDDNGGSLTVDDGGTTLSVDDGGGALTVDGTVTANLSATDNAVLDAIQVATEATQTAVEGTLTVQANDSVSTNNSTTSTLGGGATYTGTGDDVVRYAAITVSVFADQDSATDGMQFQFSTDNSNWADSVNFTMTANETRRFQFPVTARYFRVRYTNGATPQTAFRVQTILHEHPVLTSVHRIKDEVSEDRSAQLVKAAVVAQTGGAGNFVPIAASASGKLQVAAEIEDGGNSITVDNAALSVTGGGVEASALRVTLASDSTGVLSVDDNGGSLTVDNADLTTLAGAVAGSEMQVDVVGALPAGTNLIGDVVVNDIEDGAGTSVMDAVNNAIQVNVVAGSAGGTEYTEDAAAPANPAGSAVLLVRDDAASALTSADGDWVAQRSTNYGAAFVQVVDSSGNFINSFGGSGGTAMNDDSAFTPGTDQVTPAGFLADETTPDSVDEGDIGAPRMTLTRKAYAVIADPTSENNVAVDGSGHLQVDIAADSVGIGGGTQYTEDDAAAANPVGNMQIAVRADSLAAVTSTDGDNIALRATNNGELYVKQTDAVPVTDNGGSLTVDNAALSVTGGGTEASALRVTLASDSTGVLSVDDGGGALTVDGTVTADAGTGTFTVGGVAAENAAVSGNPVLAGGRYDLTPRTLGDGDVGAVALDADGAVQVSDGGNSLTVDNGGTFAVQVDAALPAGTNLIGDVVVNDIEDGAGTSVMDAVNNAIQVNVVAGSAGGTEYTEDAAAAANPAGGMLMAVRADSLAAVTSTDGDNIALRSTNNGELYVKQTDAVPVTDNGGSLTVDGTVTANLSATDNAVLDQIEVNTSYGDNTGGGVEAGALRVTIANDSTGLLSVDDNGGSLTIDNAALSVTGGGTEASALRVTIASDSTGLVSIDDGGSTISIDDGAGSITVDGTVTASNAAGDVAHDSADSGNPVKVGFKAYNFDGTAPGTAVAENDRANGISDVYGRQLVETAHPNHWQAMGLYSTAQTDASVKAAPGAGLSLYITDIVVSTDTAMNVFFEQSTTKVYGTLWLAANGGASSHFRTPIKLPANTALTFTSSATGNHSVTVNGYTAP